VCLCALSPVFNSVRTSHNASAISLMQPISLPKPTWRIYALYERLLVLPCVTRYVQLSSVHSTKSGPSGRVLRLTVEIPTDVGPLGVTVVEVKRSTHAAGTKFVIAAIDDRSFAAQYVHTRIYFARIALRSIVMSMSVCLCFCLFVCLSACIARKPRRRTSPDFLHAARGRGSVLP